MPSNIKLTASPTTVAPGGTAQITVAMTLAAPVTVHVALSQGTSQVAGADVTIPGETFPAIKLAGDPSITASDYVLATDVGTLTATSDPKVFTLHE
jgi:hypothetical protein